MPYYHLSIEIDGDEKQELDLSKDELESIMESYHRDKEFLCDGSFIKPSEVEKIKIFETDEPSKTLATLLPLYPWFFIEKNGRDVTKLFIKHSPRREKKVARLSKKTFSENVFIVHGRDHGPMKELKAMLTMFSLNPIVLHEQPSGSRTIVENLEKYSDVGYAFVILTPDDIGCNYSEVARRRKTSTVRIALMTEQELRGRYRARQNVILEFGYFIGLLGRDRVCCLYKGDVELPSDMQGIIYIPFEGTVYEVRDKIVKELKEAGYEDLYPPPVPKPM